MGVYSRREFLATVTLGFWLIFYAAAQPGFLSIDCGGRTNRTDPATNIQWITDENFIDGGRKSELTISPTPFYFQSLRMFPKPLNKSCYRLPLTPNVPHLLRIWFGGETYTIREHPNFKYSIETQEMLSLRNVSNTTLPGEKILVSSGSLLYVCLIRSSPLDDPFISAIEIRTLQQGMYSQAKPDTMLHLIARHDVGNALSLVRYPQDRFDRRWIPMIDETLQSVNTTNAISPNWTENYPPSIVMQTAAKTEQTSLTVHSNGTPINIYKPLLLLYLAEIEPLNLSESRILEVSINGEDRRTPVHLVNNHSAVQLSFSLPTSFYEFTIFKAPKSRRGPLINAFELYGRLPTEHATSVEDAVALNHIRQSFHITSWVSDPCFGVPWDGINCDNSSPVVRVSEINLSGKSLFGSIPPTLGQLTALVSISIDDNHLNGSFPDLSNLTKLERLNLQNNNLTGNVPDWLSKLPNLKELLIQRNNFSGVIPQQLLDNRSLTMKYDGNPYLCMNGTCRPSSNSTSTDNKVGIVVGATAGGVVLVALAFLMGIFLYRRKFRKEEATSSKGSVRSKETRYAQDQDFSMVLVPNPSKSRAFTLDEVAAATENFTHKIGKGGFGSVFLGMLQEGKQIAVKVLSYFSKQGVVEFLNEIDLLSKVHHRNLVSLLGYCNESRELMLVYEYMPGGSLKDHLYGPKSEEYPDLDWKSRLKIVLDAAQGMEYLHVNCNPKVIHRDVKSANILLDANLNGKLADFGLSRVTIDEAASHVTTAVKGTAGYLDPEYFSTQMLTEKSDIYSFGVVLLEIICGRRPIDVKLSEEEINLIRWVTPYVETDEDPNKITGIIDKRLGTDYDTKSVIHMARLALRCVSAEPSSRPSVREVVIEIKEAMKYQNEVTLSLQVLKETLPEDGDLQSGHVSISDYSGPKEIGSSENSSTCRSMEDK